MSRFGFQTAKTNSNSQAPRAAGLPASRRTRFFARVLCPAPGAPLVPVAKSSPPNEGSGAPGNARACEALRAAGAATRHAWRSVSSLFAITERTLLGAPLAAICVPGAVLPEVDRMCLRPIRCGRLRHPLSPHVQPLKADPRSGAGRRPGASRVRGYEPRPQAPHPAPSRGLSPEDALDEQDEDRVFKPRY